MSYIQCQKCLCWFLPHFKELHIVECGSSLVLGLTHSHIKSNGLLIVTVGGFKDDILEKDVTLGWLRTTSIFNHIVFLNEKDMIHCVLQAFSPASVVNHSSDNASLIFLTVPHPNIDPGNAYFTDEGLASLICSKNQKSLVAIERGCNELYKIFPSSVKNIPPETSFLFNCSQRELDQCINKKLVRRRFQKRSRLLHPEVRICLGMGSINYLGQNLHQLNVGCCDCACCHNGKSSQKEKSGERREGLEESQKHKNERKNLQHITGEEEFDCSYFLSDKSQSSFGIDAKNSEYPKALEPMSFMEDLSTDFEYSSIKRIVQMRLKPTEDSLPLFGLNGVLIFELPGAKINTTLQKICDELKVSMVTLSIKMWVQSCLDEARFIEKMFKEAQKRVPSVIFIEDVDSMCDFSSREKDELSKHIFRMFDKIKSSGKQILVVATTFRNCQSLTGAFFTKELNFSLPSQEERTKLLNRLLSVLPHTLSDSDVRLLSKRCNGFCAADIAVAVKRAWQRSFQRKRSAVRSIHSVGKISISAEDMEEGLDLVVPAFLRNKLVAMSKVEWSDVYGYETIKSKLNSMIERHEADPKNNPMKGILFYGPPGCSKTMMVKALATHTRFSFFPVRCSDLLSKYVGETEKELKRLFSIAYKASPSLIFMDEIDSLCRERATGTDSSGVVSELLSLIESSKGNGLLFIGATNKPELLDEALFSPGCMELLIHVDLPSAKDRLDIFTGLLSKVPHKDVYFEKLAELSSGMSGAEIYGAYRLSVQKLADSMNEGDIPCLTGDILEEAISLIQPRTQQKLLNSIAKFSVHRKDNKLL